MMKFATQSGAVLLGAALAAGGCARLLAQESQQGSVDAKPNLLVRTEQGGIEVHGKAGISQIQWSAKARPKGRVAVVVKTTPTTIEVRNDGSADLTLFVPDKMVQVTLHTGCGPLTITDMTANAVLQSEGGALDVEHVAGLTRAVTGGGNITVRDSGGSGQTARLETGGGNITIDAANGDIFATSGGGNMNVTAARGNVRIADGGGNVVVHQAGGGVQLETGGGNVEMGDIGGDVFARTGGGAIRLASAHGMVRVETNAGLIDARQLGSGIRAETGAGAILAEYARNLHFLESKLETGSGDVTVWLPNNLAAAIQVTAGNPFGHTIRADFDAVRVAGGVRNDGELRAQGLMNGGGPLLRVETGNGNVALLRLK